MKYAPIIYTQSHLYTHQIPDIVESLLSNNSTFVKFAEWALNNDIKLWRAYNWTIVYFYSIRNHISFAKNEELLNDSLHGKDEIKTQIKEWERDKPYNKSCAENATQWLRDEFNPLITESMPPVITQFAAVSDVGFFYAYTKVSVELRDPSGIGTIRLISKPEKDLPLIYDIRIFDGKGTTIWKIKNLKLNITADAAAYHYFVVCNASDSLGNTAQWIKKVNGPVGAFVDTLAKLLSALWGFLCEVGKTLAKAVSILIEWVKNLILSVLNALLSPIYNTLNVLTSKFVEFIHNTFMSRAHHKSYTNEWDRLFHSAGFYKYVMILSYGLCAAYYGVAFAIQGVPGLGQMIFMAILSALVFGAVGMAAGEVLSWVVDKIKTGATPFLKWLFDYAGVDVSDEFFQEGVGLTLSSIITSFLEYLMVKVIPSEIIKEYQPKKPGLDAKGLFFSFIGLILLIAAAKVTPVDTNSAIINLALNIMGLSFAIGGVVYVLLKNDIFDNVFGPIAKMEETLAITNWVYSIVSVVDSIRAFQAVVGGKLNEKAFKE